MVQGPSGPDEVMSEIPDGVTHYHYPEIYFSGDGEEVYFFYLVSPRGQAGTSKWRAFPASWLYQGEPLELELP